MLHPLLRPLCCQPVNQTDPPSRNSTTCPSSWPNQSASELFPLTCVMSDWYEPYLAIRYCRDTPPFQEAFTGYGKNKITWMWHLRALSYELFQIGSAFSVHIPHKASRAYSKWKSKAWAKQKVRKIVKTFKQWMKANIPSYKMRKNKKMRIRNFQRCF